MFKYLRIIFLKIVLPFKFIRSYCAFMKRQNAILIANSTQCTNNIFLHQINRMVSVVITEVNKGFKLPITMSNYFRKKLTCSYSLVFMTFFCLKK